MNKPLILVAILAMTSFTFASNVGDSDPSDAPIAATQPDDHFCIEMGLSDLFGGDETDESNSIYHIDLGALVGSDSVEITEIGWDVIIEPQGDSWYSDATLGFAVESGDGIAIAPGVGEDFAFDGSPHNYVSAPLNLVDVGVGNLDAANGVFVLTFFEAYDDLPGSADSLLLGGSTIRVNFNDEDGDSYTADIKWGAVPEPQGLGLVLAGTLGLFGLRRKLRS